MSLQQVAEALLDEGTIAEEFGIDVDIEARAEPAAKRLRPQAQQLSPVVHVSCCT